MQIAESSDQKRQRKCMMMMSNTRFVENNEEFNGRYHNSASSQNSLVREDYFRIPDEYMLHKFAIEFLKSDGVFFYKVIINTFIYVFFA